MKAVSALVLATVAAPAVLAQGETFVNWETPHVHPLSVTPDGSTLLAVNLPDNRLEAFDLSGALPKWSFSVPVGLDPVSVRARTNEEVWVVNHVSDSVSIVDLATRNVVATLDTDDEPADVVFAGVPQRAFVSCSQANTVLVFDPADLSLAPTKLTIAGEDPRAMAVSPAGDEVYVAVFESGNDTTILGGGIVANLAFPPNVVSDPAGPYAGVNPPPNSGAGFGPPIKAGLPNPPAVGLIVRRDSSGNWLDDNTGDWTALVSGPQAALSGRPVGWTLLDHDVAIIDASALTVTYADHLMNICMAIGVNPATGKLGVVGTDATNDVRFEPNLNGTFTRTKLALVDPVAPSSSSVVDLNGHLTYATSTVVQSERDKTVADPRGVAWNAAGTRAYVAGMGSNNVVVLDATGARVGIAPTIEVGEGPTGLVFDGTRDRLYVINKFEASISVVNTTTELEIARVGFYDPSPVAIKIGRRHLYDAHATSGLGLTACAACHVDARMDRLAWDLGNPQGDMKSPSGQNLGAKVPGLDTGFEDWHPMKGPMLTQTLQDIIGKEPHHWRGDKDGLEDFNGAFEALLGDDEGLDPDEMQEFEDFLATIHFPPNPFRRFDNTLRVNLALPGHFDTGVLGPAGVPLPNGSAEAGKRIYTPPRLLDNRGIACATCHTLPTGIGTGRELSGTTFVPIPLGPKGESHHALVSVDGLTNVTLKIPQLRNLHERTGFDMTQMENTAGFGFAHDGSVDSIARFVSEPVFTLSSTNELANLVAFLLSFSGSDLPTGSATNLFHPIGPSSQDTRAAVGTQTTLVDGANPDPAVIALIDKMIAEADAGTVGLVVRGRRAGVSGGWFYHRNNTFQSDRRLVRLKRSTLQAGAGPGNELTFTVVPKGTEERIGVDRDEDRAYDGDELDARTDPADPASRPKIRKTS